MQRRDFSEAPYVSSAKLERFWLTTPLAKPVMLMGERIWADVSSLLHLWASFQEGRQLRAHAITCIWIMAQGRSILFLVSELWRTQRSPFTFLFWSPTQPSAAASRRRKVHLSPLRFMHLHSAPLLYPCPMPSLEFSFLWEQQSHTTRHHWSLENLIQDRQTPRAVLSSAWGWRSHWFLTHSTQNSEHWCLHSWA